jgi:hypothetical protein
MGYRRRRELAWEAGVQDHTTEATVKEDADGVALVPSVLAALAVARQYGVSLKIPSGRFATWSPGGKAGTVPLAQRNSDAARAWRDGHVAVCLTVLEESSRE